MVIKTPSVKVFSTLPASEFPQIENIELVERVSLPEATLKELIDRTAFAMAHQDVRYYLNGTLLDVREGALRCVATDGHRLALCETQIELDRRMLQDRIDALKKELEQTEKRMAQLAQEKTRLETSMSQPASPADLAEAGRRLKAVNDETETLEARWLELHEAIEAVGT